MSHNFAFFNIIFWAENKALKKERVSAEKEKEDLLYKIKEQKRNAQISGREDHAI